MILTKYSHGQVIRTDITDMKLFVNDFYLTAAEVNAQEEMPLSRLVTLIIDTATGHANLLGFGYAHMMECNTSWVLSRLSIDILHMPGVNQSYRLFTWVESVNRIYSERLFELQDTESGETIAWAHTVWMAIDMDTRRPSDLSVHTALVDVINDRPFGGTKSGKLHVSTVIRVLEKKGYVSHEKEGGTYRYHPLLEKDSYKKTTLMDMLKNYFDNNFKSLVSALVEEKELTDEEIKECIDIIEKKKQ